MFRRILEHALKFENVQIVLVSIIPSVVEDTKRRFSELSNILKDLSKNEFRATSTFLNMNSIFAHEGKIEPQYFKSIDIDENNRQRNVHLKFFGACQLARSILDHCTLHVKNKLQYQYLLFNIVLSFSMYIHTYRPVVPWCAGCAMAHPDFGRSVNPISTRGDNLCPPNYYLHTRICRPSDGPRLKLAKCAFCKFSLSRSLQRLGDA